MRLWKPGLLLLSLLLGGCSEKTPQPIPRATLFTAASVLTMDASNSRATAVVVADGRILAVGSPGSVRADLPGYQLQENGIFKDKVLMPGFVEPHLHPILAGILMPTRFITPWAWDLPSQQVDGVQGRDNYLAQLKKIESEMEGPQETLITWGYHQYFHGQIGRPDINEISSIRPIIVWHRSFHEIYANDAALAMLGITAAEFGEHPAIDLAQGHFWETGLFAIFPKLQAIVLEPGRLSGGVLEALEHSRQNGITTLADQGVPLFNLDMEMSLLDTVLSKSQLPLRMLVIGNAASLQTYGAEQAFRLIETMPERNTANIRFLPKQVKLLADGAFYSQLMQLQDGYLDGHHGEWIMAPDELNAIAEQYWQADYQLHIHVNGDKGLQVVLDMIERLQKIHPRTDHRTVLHHYGYSAAEQSDRVASLGISVSANPYYLWALGDKYAEIGMGPERAHNITRLGSLERRGVSLSFHSDLPMAPAAPLTLAAIAASRLTATNTVMAPLERLSVDTALRGITIEAARAIAQQETIGSIEVGKLADFTVLEQNPYEVAPEAMRDIAIWGTVFGGQLYPK